VKELSGLRMGKFFGVELFIHKSWLILFGLLLYGFFQMFDQLFGVPLFLKCFFTFVSVIMVVITLLAHELAHCLVGRKFGFAMKKMTLFALGGAAHIEDPNGFYKIGPGGEFKMAIAGPIMSFLCAGVFFALLKFAISGWLPVFIRDFFVVWRIYIPIALMLNLIFVVNMLVGCFNLLPAFPMDGGRILRSVIWHKKGLLTATNISCFIGRLMGIVGFPLIGFFFFGNLFSVAWLSFIGFLILVPACHMELKNVRHLIEKGELK
jgi:Zn-dependent protease